MIFSLLNQRITTPSLYRAWRLLHTPSPIPNREVEEITIKVPWGHVAGKWWGPKDARPILALHGWQDNAGTFDTLIPRLPNHIGYLAIDFPGHGMSSHFPAGMTYSTLDYLHLIDLIRHEMKWDRISIMAHSMGSQISFYYVATRPHLCDLFIGLDVLKPLVRKYKRNLIDFSNRFDKLRTEHKRLKNPTEPPTYTMDEMIELMHVRSFQSITRETAPYLLKRAAQKSMVHPGRYFFRRDSRIKVFNYAITFHEYNLEMARNIRAAHLFIKAENASFFEDEKYFRETIDVLKGNPLFEFVMADGTHHVHLTDPDKVSGTISDFINRYRPAT